MKNVITTSRRYETTSRLSAFFFMFTGVVLIPASSFTRADDDTAAPAEESSVVATVDGEPIHFKEVKQGYEGATHAPVSTVAEHPEIAASVLDQLINHQAVENFLAETGSPVTPEQVEAAIAHTVPKRGGKPISIKEFLETTKVSLKDLRKNVTWQLRWQRALQELLTDEVMEAYFKAHHKQYDGSIVRANHILLRPQKVGDPVSLQMALVAAKSLRDKIKSGKTTFADAVAKYSDGPSRANGGDVGFFPRHDVVAEPFAEAAFKLEKDQISEPVATSFGVHLIQLTDVKPSEKEVKWQDVRQDIAKPAGEELYDQLARRERGKASVVFAGNWPYFDPVTREVVKPKTESEDAQQ